MYFRSVADLNTAVARWTLSLPHDIEVIAGIPRSGLLPAALLALYRNLPLTDVDGIRTGRLLQSGARAAEVDAVGLFAERRRILVVDDSIDSGAAIQQARSKLVGLNPSHDLMFAAVYASNRRAVAQVDAYAELLPRPRVFEWNVLHHPRLVDACMDIDGVLCRDPTAEENDDGPRYGRFVSTVPARYRPPVLVGHLVTARLEKYRRETEEWLARQGIRYGQLHMLKGVSAAQRRVGRLHSVHKANVYKRTNAWLFIESSLLEAHEIADLCNKPVYCTEAGRMVYAGHQVGAAGAPSHRDRARWRVNDQLRQLAAKLHL